MGLKICKFCGSNMNSQETDVYTKEILLECFVCPNCHAVYDCYMDRKYKEIKNRNQWWNPNSKEFEPIEK